jgi:tetratricopeptide (TPR) repeat protein
MALEIDPADSLRYYKTLLNAYYRLGNYRAAKDNAHAALQMDPNDKAVLNQLGALYDAEQNLPKAIKYYTRLLQTDTLNPYYQRQCGFVHLKAGFKREAFRYFARAYRLNPGDVVVVNALADLLMGSENYSQADSVLQAAHDADTTNVQVLLSMARSKYQQKEYEEAVRKLEKVNLQVDIPEYYIKMLGYAYLQIDSADQAIYWLERLVHSEQKEFVHYYLAIAYDKKGDPDASLFHYEKAIRKSVSENIDRYYAEAARVHESQGNLREAIAHYRKALEYNKAPKYYYELGILSDIYFRDKGMALTYFNKYLKSGDDHPVFRAYAEKRARYLEELLHFTDSGSN